MLSGLLVMMGLKKEWPTFTAEEIEGHNNERSLWIVAGTNVYDVTTFLPSHPGGPNALLKRGGGLMDCTQDLKFHSAKGKAEWQKYQIGVVASRNGSSSARISRRSSLGPASQSTGNSAPMSTSTSQAPCPVTLGGGVTNSAALPPLPDCCCTKTPAARAASEQPRQHCPHCSCPDRPVL